jgi:hypothetical protein
VLLANTYGAVGMRDKQAAVWSEMKEKNIKKIPGATWVTVNGKTEIFYVDSYHLYPSTVVGLLVRWFIGSLVRWFVGSLVRWFVGSLVRWFVGSLVHWFIGSLVRWIVGWFDYITYKSKTF